MWPSLQQLMLVAVGGALGASTRFVVTKVSTELWGDRFPWGTLIVNVVGCFALGLLMRFGPSWISDQTKLLIGVGVLGGLTTFSTFAMDTVSRWQQQEWLLGWLNISANLAIGLIAVAIGTWVGGAFVAQK